MRYYKYSYCIFLIICLFPFCKENNPVDICLGFENKVYKYSIYNCTEADSLDCYQKRLKSVLLPEQYLKCSSTDSLTRTCLNYPFLPNIWLYNSLQLGFDHVKDVFNGFDELFKRENTNTELKKIYQGMNPANVDTISDPVSRGAFMSQFTFIEITLAQYQLIDKLNEDEGKTLINLCLNKYNIKSSIPSYTWVGSMSTLAIIARILYTANYEPFVNLIPANQNLEYFIQYADFDDMSPDIINEITQIMISNANNYTSGLNK
jgi:hypothetical protein